MKNQLVSAATLCLLLTLLFAHHRAGAQVHVPDEISSGMLHYSTHERALLLSTDVEMTITGMLVRTSLTQRFYNDSPFWQEGIYVFPLPDDASVDTLEMQIGDRSVKGIIKTRSQATTAYETAKAQGSQASLVEQQRANLFTTQVANIPPGESIDVTIGFQSAVQYEDGVFSTRFPLTLTPRYTPVVRLPVDEPLDGTMIPQDAGWSNMNGISPPMVPAAQAARTTITADINAGLPLQSITSRTHQIVAQERLAADGVTQHWQVQLAHSDIPMDRDVELSWAPPPGRSPGAAVFRENQLTAAKPITQNGDSAATYASVMLVPPQQLFDSPRPPREVLFVIDTSGSMQGSSIVQARRALALGISRLTRQDAFNVIEFDDAATSLFADVQPANDANRTLATDWINQLRADGGTEILPAMKLAFHDHNIDHARLRQVVFVTDGSVGNEAEIFHYIKSHLNQSRLFTVGIGSAPNTWFMRKAAQAGRGSYVFIPRVQDVADTMRTLFNKLEKPVLTNIQLDVLGTPETERYPSTIADLYAGEPIVIDLHWQGIVDDAEIVISGEHAGQSWSRKLSLPAATTQSGQLAKQFAAKKITALQDSQLFHHSPQQVEKQITDLALDYGLVTPFTSLVAVAEKVVRDLVKDTLQATEVPAAMPFGNTMAFPQGSLGLTLRWLLAAVFSLLSVIFALATLQQVRSYTHE
jgi:Ca-activated chloride channel family protein